MGACRVTRLYELRLTPSETILVRSLIRGTMATEEALLNYIFAWLRRGER